MFGVWGFRVRRLEFRVNMFYRDEMGIRFPHSLQSQGSSKLLVVRLITCMLGGPGVLSK